MAERKTRTERRADRRERENDKSTSKEVVSDIAHRNMIKAGASALVGGLLAGIGRALHVAASEAADWADFKVVLRQLMGLGLVRMMGQGMERLGIMLIAYGTIMEDEMSDDPSLQKKYAKAFEEARKTTEAMISDIKTGRRQKIPVKQGSEKDDADGKAKTKK